VLPPALASRFRALTLGDPSMLAALLAWPTETDDPSTRRAASLLRIAVLVGLDAGTPVYQREVNEALAAGATPEEIYDLLPTIASLVGTALVMAAAPRIALALGYDVDAAMESMDADEPGG